MRLYNLYESHKQMRRTMAFNPTWSNSPTPTSPTQCLSVCRSITQKASSSQSPLRPLSCVHQIKAHQGRGGLRGTWPVGEVEDPAVWLADGVERGKQAASRTAKSSPPLHHHHYNLRIHRGFSRPGTTGEFVCFVAIERHLKRLSSSSHFLSSSVIRSQTLSQSCVPSPSSHFSMQTVSIRQLPPTFWALEHWLLPSTEGFPNKF